MSAAAAHLRGWVRRHELYVALGTLLLLFLLAWLWPNIVVSIGPGRRGVLWSRISGTYMNRVYTEGMHIILPWDEMTSYDVRYQLAERRFTVMSRDGLPVMVDLAVRYQPAEKLVTRLHEFVGPKYREVVVMSEVVEALRAVVAQYPVKDLHADTFAAIAREVTQYTRNHAAPRWVLIDDVLFRGVTLPPNVTAAIERKVEQEHAALEMDYRLAREEKEARRKVIEAGGVRDYQRLVGETLTDRLLQYKGIEATLQLAQSPNAKVVVIGSGRGNLPVILNPETALPVPKP